MENILLLHGLMSSKQQMALLSPELGKIYSIHAIDFFCHGEETEVTDLSAKQLIAQCVEYINANALYQVHVIGYGYGAYIALSLAKHFPELVSSIICFTPQLTFDETFIVKQEAYFSTETFEKSNPEAAANLKQKHGDKWKTTVTESIKLIKDVNLKPEISLTDLKNIQLPCFIIAGDQDPQNSLLKIVELYRLLPNAELYIAPRTKHLLTSYDFNTLMSLLKKFLYHAKQ